MCSCFLFIFLFRSSISFSWFGFSKSCSGLLVHWQGTHSICISFFLCLSLCFLPICIPLPLSVGNIISYPLKFLIFWIIFFENFKKDFWYFFSDFQTFWNFFLRFLDFFLVFFFSDFYGFFEIFFDFFPSYYGYNLKLVRLLLNTKRGLK